MTHKPSFRYKFEIDIRYQKGKNSRITFRNSFAILEKRCKKFVIVVTIRDHHDLEKK